MPPVLPTSLHTTRSGVVAMAVAMVLGAAPSLGAQTPPASPFVGDWEGSLSASGQVLPIRFHITANEDALSATMDSPAQNAFGIPIDEVQVSGDSISLTLRGAGARFDGVLTASGGVEGTWSQGMANLELKLERMEEGAAAEAGGVPDPATRPQTPRPPFPYMSEEVAFPGGGDFELAGTFTSPTSGGPHPGVILVTGSGPQDRDETLLGHKPFAVLADHLTRSGIAVLRYDDRGTAASGGVFKDATSDDFARDAEAALRFLSSRSEVDPARVGIVGHSEGGLVGPLVASRSDLPAFLVLLAGPGMTGREILLDQARAMAAAQGVDAGTIEGNLSVNRQLFDIVEREPDPAAADEEMRAVLRARLAELDAATRAMSGIAAGQEEAFVNAQVSQVNSPWFRYFITYDPVPALEATDIPVLAVNGELDLQVTPTANLAAIESALERAGNPDVTVRELAGLNHLFQAATTGLLAEYSQIDETMNPVALEMVSEWIRERFGGLR